jgi:preprotein translocase subunit SecA
VPTEAGIEKVERQLGVDNLYDAVATNYVHQLTKALRPRSSTSATRTTSSTTAR